MNDFYCSAKERIMPASVQLRFSNESGTTASLQSECSWYADEIGYSMKL